MRRVPGSGSLGLFAAGRKKGQVKSEKSVGVRVFGVVCSREKEGAGEK